MGKLDDLYERREAEYCDCNFKKSVPILKPLPVPGFERSNSNMRVSKSVGGKFSFSAH